MNTLKKNKALHKSRFTMIELVTVISIMAILLTISIKAMQTDSTSANASILGSTLSYAQTYAMSSLQTDGTQTIEVVVAENKVTISVVDTDEVANSVEIKEEDLATGSKITSDTGTYVFDKNGTPQNSSGTNLSGKVEFTITDTKNTSNTLTVTLRAFTGKVVYY
jgi:type II secretory pathway pseudopilin PulG